MPVEENWSSPKYGELSVRQYRMNEFSYSKPILVENPISPWDQLYKPAVLLCPWMIRLHYIIFVIKYFSILFLCACLFYMCLFSILIWMLSNNGIVSYRHMKYHIHYVTLYFLQIPDKTCPIVILHIEHMW